MSKRILVIGGLAAGPSAASKAVRASTDVEVVMFEQGEHISYGICEIPYYIAGEVKEEGLVVYTPAKLKETKGVDARILHKVEEIQPTRKH
ncbi:MAG TPA: pyridine nucleotide-disulfide oxidoreductase, partial [Bacteroidetes bacterium]|nr:pyridine nucleotide-disulfide oxidoreductase [Bacteroidota bacterium]